MDSARKMAERALAEADRAVSAWGSNAILVSEKRLSTALGYLAAATRALLAAEPAKAPFVSRNEEWGLRPDFTTAGVPAPPAGAEPAPETPDTYRVEGHDEQDANARQPEDETERRDLGRDAATRESAAVLGVQPADGAFAGSAPGGVPDAVPVLRGGTTDEPVAPAPPDGAEVREAAEELQRIDSLLARRITLDGLTRVQKIALALRVCEETDPKGEVAARYVCRGGQKGER